MSVFDGSKDPLGYGEALVQVALVASWGSDARRNEVVRAIQAEHDILPPEPDAPVYTDPRDATLVAQTAELETLRKEKAERDAADKATAQQAEIDQLKADAAAAAKTKTKTSA